MSPRRRKRKTYKIYGYDKGEKKHKDRYLFTTSAFNKKDALRQARHRVKGAKVITRIA